MKKTIMPVVLLAVLLAACGGDVSGSKPSRGDGEPVLSVTIEGGFVPIEFNLDRMPTYHLMGDRSLHYQGPTTLEFPGPILPNVLVTTLDESAHDEVLGLLEEMGMAEIDERVDQSGAENIADAGTTFLTYYDHNGSHRYGFYALEIAEGGSTDRLLANEILEYLEAATSGGSRPYEPERLQVAAGPPMQAGDVAAGVQEWPLDIPFEEMDEWGIGWRCTEVTGAEVAEVVESLSSANQATVWETSEERLGIRARPLLPGETACQNAPANV